MWPAIAGALAGGALGLIGARQNEKSQEGIHRENVALQKEFAQHGIRWRVEDAQAAGVHPLFALGGAGASYSPSAVVGSGMGDAIADMGQNLGRAIAAQETADQRQARLIGLEVQASTIRENDARADYFRAEAAKARQGMVQSSPAPSADVVHQGAPNTPEPFSGFYDRSKVQASPTYSRDSTHHQVAAGSGPFWRAFQLRRDGLMMDLPFSEEGPSESLQDLPMWMYPEVLRHNMDRYGGDWLVKFLSAYPDSPIGQWLQRGAHSGGGEFRSRGGPTGFE